MCPDTDAYTQNQTVHIGTRRVHPFECHQGTSHILHFARRQPQHQSASHRGCKRLHSGAFCPSWSPRMSFCRRLRQLLRKPERILEFISKRMVVENGIEDKIGMRVIMWVSGSINLVYNWKVDWNWKKIVIKMVIFNKLLISCRLLILTETYENSSTSEEFHKKITSSYRKSFSINNPQCSLSDAAKHILQIHWHHKQFSRHNLLLNRSTYVSLMTLTARAEVKKKE